MIVLAYIASIIAFMVLDLIVGSIVRTVYLFVSNTQSFFYQFIGEFVGVGVAYFLSIYIFSWISNNPPLIILALILWVFWFLANIKIEQAHYPLAQRLGGTSGLLGSLAYLLT